VARFAERLTQLRNERGLTQPELAERMGMSNGAIGNYESGRRVPRIDDLEAFADFFNVDMNYLLGYSNERPDYTLEQIWVMECYSNISDENDRAAVTAILRKYDRYQKVTSSRSLA